MADDIEIEMHSKTGCDACDGARAWLAERGIRTTEIKHDDHGERQGFYDSLGLRPGERTVPQLFLIDVESGERFRIGGFDKLKVSGIGDH